MKTFEKFFNEEYDYRNVEITTSRKYQPRQDFKNSYMTGLTQPGGGNITFTPMECEELKNKKQNKQIKQRVKNDRNKTVNRSKRKIHI